MKRSPGGGGEVGISFLMSFGVSRVFLLEKKGGSECRILKGVMCLRRAAF